jgi:hypothetical protein
MLPPEASLRIVGENPVQAATGVMLKPQHTFLVVMLGMLLAGAYAADMPKPRARLVREASGTVARIEERTVSQDEPVVLKKVEVVEPKLPAPPAPLREKVRHSFSLADGGPMLDKRSGKFEFFIGFWRHPELLDDDARFGPAGIRAEFDVLRIRR